MKYDVIQYDSDSGQKQKEQLVPGTYDFEVVDVVEKKSKKGMPMLQLKLIIKKQDIKRQIFDYIMANAPWKIKQFLNSVGLEDQYEKGEILPEDCIGKTGNVKIYIRHTEYYGYQASVSGYISTEEDICKY